MKKSHPQVPATPLWSSLGQLAQLLRGLKVPIFFNEGVAFDGICIWPFCWVFSEDERDEAAQLWRALLHLEVLRDDLGQIILVLNFERIFASE